jgi:hypothetical protein
MNVYVRTAVGSVLAARDTLETKGFKPRVIAGVYDLLMETEDDEAALHATGEKILEIDSVLETFFEAVA